MAAGLRTEGDLVKGYDVVVFDCDGVLLDSNNLKTVVFQKVLAHHGFEADEIARFRDYQVRNFGVSRYRLFDAVVEGRFGEARDVSLERLLEDFGRLCRTGYLEQPETAGMREALARAGADGRPLYVVSGSDEAELRDVLHQRRLAASFSNIYGSPATKIENLDRVRAHRRAQGAPEGERMLFVGDAEADMLAATAAGADFVFMAGYSTVRPSLEPQARAGGCVVIEDLRYL